MSAFTKKIEGQIRNLGLALKLQLDFAAAADMTKPSDQIELAQNNMKAGAVMLELIKTLKIDLKDDAAVPEDIVAFAEKNGSDAGKILKGLIPKVRAVNTEVRDTAMQRMAQQQQITPEDLNRIFRKHLAP